MRFKRVLLYQYKNITAYKNTHTTHYKALYGTLRRTRRPQEQINYFSTLKREGLGFGTLAL